MTPWAFALHGDVKSFFFAVFPYSLTGEEPQPNAQGIADFRLKGELAHGPWRLDVHEEISVFPPAPVVVLGGSAAGLALTAPEFVDLTWQPDTGDNLVVRGRIDRLAWSIEAPHVTVTAGRQPLSFGSGLVFTPMDVVNPFGGATIDTEYKPGIDALRVDAYAGTSVHATAIAAWVGSAPIHDSAADPGFDDLVLGATGGGTVGTTDVFGLALLARNEPVLGAGFAGSAGPVGLHGDATLTVPTADALEHDPFVRAVLGADGRPTGTTTISGELYVQTFGASDPSGYLPIITGPRYLRGEIWTAGRIYAAVAASQEITPLIIANVALIANLDDPSALIAPGVSWSVADEAVVVAGMYAGVGERPVAVEPVENSVKSEFGLYPVAAYVQMKAYF